MPEPARIGLPRPRARRREPSSSSWRERAYQVEAQPGRRPELAGVLTPLGGRLRRDPRRLGRRRRADRRHRPGPRLRAARAAGGQARGHREQAARRPARRRALRGRPEAGVQLRFEAAVAGVVPVIRVIQESLGGDADRARASGSSTGRPTSSSREMAAHRRRLRRTSSPGRRSSATRRPTRPRTSAAPTRRRRWRSSPGWPSTPRWGSPTSPTRGSTEIQPDDLAYAKELGLSLKLLGVAERRDEGISVRVFPCFLYARPPAGARSRARSTR